MLICSPGEYGICAMTLLGVVTLMLIGATSDAGHPSFHWVQYERGVACRISGELAERHTGGARDCRTRRIDRDGTCYCPSDVGPLPGQALRRRHYSEDSDYEEPHIRCRVSAEASRLRDGERDCGPISIEPDGRCYCTSPRGPIPGHIIGD